MQKLLSTFLYLASFLLATAFSIKSLREPDLWWQIRTGEWILQNHQVPVTDVFSFTHAGQQWINIKWGFEVLAAIITKFAGPESVFLLQIPVSVLLLFFIKKILAIYKMDTPALFFCITIILLFGIEYRIIGRPEMFSHLFVVIFSYLLLLYHHKPSKLIFVLIPLQIIWCNMHEAYSLGIVMLLVYTTVSWVRAFYQHTPRPGQLTAVTFLCIISLVVNPRGVLLLTRPFNIFGQVQQNKYTTELDSFLSADFWHKESYLFIGISVLLLVYLVRNLKSVKTIFTNTVFPTEYLAICLAFFFLSFTAYRNIVFFFLTIIPVVAFFIPKFFNPERFKLFFAITAVFAYIFIVSNGYYRTFRPRDHYGMELLSTHNPVGAAAYIEQKGLKNKKCFSDYLTSSYLLWKLQPGFKTYIDLRDLDIFPITFFEDYLQVINDPEQFHQLDEKEHFEYVVLYRRSNEALHHYLYNDSIYACTFVDPVAAVYEKTDVFTRGDIFQDCKPVPLHIFAKTINTIFNPFYKPFDYEELNFDLEAANYYANVSLISASQRRLDRYLMVNPQDPDALQLKSDFNNLMNSFKP